MYIYYKPDKKNEFECNDYLQRHSSRRDYISDRFPFSTHKDTAEWHRIVGHTRLKDNLSVCTVVPTLQGHDSTI